MSSSDSELLDQLLARDVVVITATASQTRQLQAKVTQSELARGRTVWDQPLIYSWHNWLRECYQALIQNTDQTVHPVLSSTQNHLLWEQAIRNTISEPDSLISVPHLAHSMAATHSLLADWCLDVTDIPDDSYDRGLRTVLNYYHQQCGRLSVQPPGQLAQQLINHITDWLPAQACHSWVWLGFEELTPIQKRLIKVSTAQGVIHNKHHPGDRSISIERHHYLSLEDELVTALQSLRTQIEKEPSASFFLAVPRLRQRRQHIERVCYRELHLNTGLDCEPEQRLFYIDSPQPLAHHALVEHALHWLNLIATGLDNNEISAWLLSSCGIGEQSGLQDRAVLDAWLRDCGVRRITVDGLRKLIDRAAKSSADASIAPVVARLDLAARLERLSAVVATTRKKQAPLAWVEHFSDCLDAVGWPFKPLSRNASYQAHQDWLSLLTQFASTGLIHKQLTLVQAWRQVRALTQETVVKDQSESAVLQVIDHNDVPGLDADYLWMTGLDSQQWPLIKEPNPLLPFFWQRDNAMPGTNPELEFQQARVRDQRLLEASRHLTLSYSELVDQQMRSPAAVLSDLANQPITSISSVIEARPTANLQLDTIVDDVGTELSPAEHRLRGVTPLADQAACPFRAYVRHRLHSRGIADWELGHSAATRGVIIHRVMERFWHELKSQQALLALNEHECRERINQAVHSVLATMPYVGNHRFWQQFIELEQQRVSELVEQWLVWERARAPFSVVQTEHAEVLQFAGLDMHLRPDRVDRLDDGTRFVIDYKTARTLSIQDWIQQRPEAVQLLLYLLVLSDVSAIAYARLRDGETGWIGLAADEIDGLEMGSDRARKIKPVSSVKPLHQDWQAWQRQWRQEIQQLVNEYKSGCARVDPKPHACDYCELDAVCRVKLV